MLKKILIFVGFVAAALPVLCFNNYDIDTLENAKYGKTFQDESISERLGRLENDLLGMTQSGDIDTRLSKLSRAAGGTNINPDNIVYPKNSYYDIQPKRNVFQRFLDNVSDTFGSSGIVTGYIPGTYMPNYGYSSNMYRNEFRKMFYNPPAHYCPYNNFDRYSAPYFPPISNRIMPKQRFSAVPGSFNFNNNLNNRYYYPRYGNYRNYNGMYYPENVVTRTSVHILP